MRPFDFFQRGNLEYLEELHQMYLHDPDSVDREWALFFTGFEMGSDDASPYRAALIEAQTPAERTTPPAQLDPHEHLHGVQNLVHSYRELGHFEARLDPLGQHRPEHPLLKLEQFGRSEAELDSIVGNGTFEGETDGTLRGLLEKLRATYCNTLGVEFTNITDKAQREWLQARMEPGLNRPQFSAEQSRRILKQLISAETFETFLHTKYMGQKRFSVEGAEALIPLLETVIEEAAELGAEEVVMGMSHRGRLNVLAHVLQKPFEIIFSEFEGTPAWDANQGDGDVKYHLGFSNDRETASGKKIHCSLSYNPSHLELVDPVIQGIVRAKQEHKGDRGQSRVVPILIHGEAAFTGQGIVPETLNLSELKSYRVGGTIHVIVNNQVGFTATAEQTRFTPYPTDVARMIQAPIFHVNADDPEAVVYAGQLAIAFRQQFKVDVMIDLWCYRRRGHNEGDDPSYTQPLMYRRISEHPTVVRLYSDQLEAEGKVTERELVEIMQEIRGQLTQAMELARERRPQQKVLTLGGLWQGLSRNGETRVNTAIDLKTIVRVTDRYLNPPADFHIHSKLKRQFATRGEMAAGAKPIDWGCAEMWSLGSLLLEGTHIRLVGQDSERGTFSHRHAVLHDVENGETYVPLQHLAEEQARFTILNTMLSELAVLGFEYGYSSADPHSLVIWEAQFGDFVNGAQPIIDQFLASAESKWNRMSGLVLLLPHGYEGQGPEHSSARLERFLQLCGDNNMQVCYPTQSAQYFHLLRRQMRRNFRKPLIIMAPKSLLREERAGSSLEDFTQSSFQLVLDDPRQKDPAEVQRLIFCSGRVFFPLDAARTERQLDSVAIVRVEQLYPFPEEEIRAMLARYSEIQEVCWVQEEPRNMGAWSYLEPRMRELLPTDLPLAYIGRDEAASPATGIHHMHDEEEKAFIEEALRATLPALRGVAPHVH